MLLVDDEAGIRHSVSEALQDNGFEVLEAADGREALEILRNGPRRSTILLDLMVPGKDGWDFRQEQLNDPELRDIPIMFVSASRSSPEAIWVPFGPAPWIAKPVQYFELLESLGRALLVGLSSLYELDGSPTL